MRLTALVIASLPALLVGCTTTDRNSPASELAEGEGAPTCNLAAVEQFIGQVVTQEMGRELLMTSGARSLRWAPPRSPMTMDYRPDRLTVSYDDDMVIERIDCV